jgi:hypothetical protein
MTDIQKLIRGLQLLDHYGARYISAGHDVIYAGGETDYTPEARETLEEAGWHWDASYESWYFFT